MDFTIGFIKSENHILVQNFKGDSASSKTVEISEIKHMELNALLYDQHILNEQTQSILIEQIKFYPIFEAKEFNLTKENFFNESKSNLLKTIEILYERWSIQNNIKTIRELFDVLEHLKDLWPNDRSTFFEELWFIIKSNISTIDLKIIFNNLEQDETENSKPKLIHSTVDGINLPELKNASESDSLLMKNFSNDFNSFFEIKEFNVEKGELVATATIDQGPILVMAHVTGIGQLQKSILVSLFNGINYIINH